MDDKNSLPNARKKCAELAVYLVECRGSVVYSEIVRGKSTLDLSIAWIFNRLSDAGTVMKLPRLQAEDLKEYCSWFARPIK